MKARSESNDDLPLSKLLNIPMCIIIVKSVFQEDNNIIHKFYYMNVCISMRINFSNQILLFSSCLKFHFCSYISLFSNEISLLINSLVV